MHQNRLYAKLLGRFDNLPLRPEGEIEIMKCATSVKEFFNKRKAPLLFRGAALNWPCTNNWNFEYFKENYGDTPIKLNDNVGLVDFNNLQQFRIIPLRQYLLEVEKGTTNSLKFNRNLFNEHPEIQEHFDLEWLRKLWLPHSMREEMVLFMSGKGSLTPVHAAPSCNFFVQVHGKKTWTMFEPRDRIFLDVKSIRSYYYYSEQDPDRPPDDQFPLFKFARRYQVTLEPGDILWVPPFMWHHVKNDTDSIGVSYRFLNLREAFANSFTLMSLILFARDPHPLVHLYHSVIKKSTVIFEKPSKKRDEKSDIHTN